MAYRLYNSTSQPTCEIASSHFTPNEIVNERSINASNRQQNNIVTDGVEKYKIEQG